MKRFVKVMALFALFLLTLAVFDRLQPTLTAVTPLTTFAVYEVKQLQWTLDDTADYDYDAALVNLSNGEAKLKLQKVIKEIKNASQITLPMKKEDDDDGKGNKTEYKKEYKFESEAYSYSGKLIILSFQADTPEKTAVKFQIKTAATEEGLKDADWLGPQGKEGNDFYTASGEAISSKHGTKGHVQYKAILETDDNKITPTLKSVTVTYETEEYPAEAVITTKEYAFGKSVEIQKLTTEEQLNGQAIKYEYSTDSGQAWKTPISGQALAAAASKILIKATLSSNRTETPAVKDIKLIYRINICDEKWQVNYTSCGKDDKRTKYYTDANSCGSTEDLPTDNGTTESCDYCTPQWANASSSCRSDDTIAVSYTYSNTCCQETGLASDCAIPQNTTASCDYCTPVWTETNSSCRSDDKITASYSDANNCYAATGLQSDNNKPANKTYQCDYCTPSFSCSGYGDCSEGNKKACTQANDSNNCYGKTGLASDSYSGNYGEFSGSCTYDSESPAISSVTAAVSGSTLTITASITDKSATTATAQLVKDGTAVMNVTLANTTASAFTGVANAAALKGAYMVTVVAKDKYGNTQMAKGIAGFATLSDRTIVREFSLNGTAKALLKLTNTTQIELAGKASADIQDIRIVLSEHAKDILNTTKPTGKRELQKYVEVEADEGLKANVSSATLRISYTDEEVLTANISEASLALHFYNETALVWQQLNSTANTALNYVEGNTTHLSLFGIFGNEQNQTTAANATTNSTLTNATNATTTNQTATNQTAGTAVNETSSAQQSQQQETSTAAEAASGGGAGGAAEKRQAEKKAEAEKEEAVIITSATEADECSYEVKVELVGKPSFINKTRVNATLTNTGTCALQGVEIKLTKPLDSYISVENGNAAELGPVESLAFALKLKAAASGEAQKQPLQGFAVKELRKKAVHSGKIIITGNGVKGLGLDIEAAGPRLEKEVPMNIEVYELEQKGGKNAIAAALIAAFILLGVLGIGHNAMAKKRNRGNGKEISGINESSAAKETSPAQEPKHEEEKLSFEEKLKSVAEKWDQRQQNDENSDSGSSVTFLEKTKVDSGRLGPVAAATWGSIKNEESKNEDKRNGKL